MHPQKTLRLRRAGLTSPPPLPTTQPLAPGQAKSPSGASPLPMLRGRQIQHNAKNLMEELGFNRSRE